MSGFSRSADINIIQLLLRHGADINAPTVRRVGQVMIHPTGVREDVGLKLVLVLSPTERSLAAMVASL